MDKTPIQCAVEYWETTLSATKDELIRDAIKAFIYYLKKIATPIEKQFVSDVFDAGHSDQVVKQKLLKQLYPEK